MCPDQLGIKALCQIYFFLLLLTSAQHGFLQEVGCFMVPVDYNTTLAQVSWVIEPELRCLVVLTPAPCFRVGCVVLKCSVLSAGRRGEGHASILTPLISEAM